MAVNSDLRSSCQLTHMKTQLADNDMIRDAILMYTQKLTVS